MSDLFDEKAKDWDADAVINNLSAAVGSAIVEHVPFDARMEVLDFGAGTGLISAHVAPLVNKIVAVDISQAMLEKLAAKPQLRGKVQILCQDIVAEPLAARFDVIMSAMALHHVKDTQALLGVFAAHLKPGGIIALADLDQEDGSFHPPGTEGVFHCGFDRDALQGLLQNSGFTNINFFTAHTVVKEAGKYPVFLVVAKK